MIAISCCIITNARSLITIELCFLFHVVYCPHEVDAGNTTKQYNTQDFIHHNIVVCSKYSSLDS
jgi:hypothetical protein